MGRVGRSSDVPGGSFRVIPPRRWRFWEHGRVREAVERARVHRSAGGSYERAERGVEEFVRQWMIWWLVETVGFPADWLGSRILIEEPIQFGSTFTGNADIVIKRQDRRSAALVETKARGKLRGAARDRAVGQLESYISATCSAEYGIVTDGDTTIFLRWVDRPRGIEVVPLSEAPEFLRGLRQAAGADDWSPVAAEASGGGREGDFVEGALYTRRQIHDVVGGTLQGYLPTVGGRVVAGCFDAVLNPSVPYEVLVGDGPVILKTARTLADQEDPIPVFVKQGKNRWEYVGRFRAVGCSKDRNDVEPRAKAAGRCAKAVLSLAPADR